MLSSGFMTQTPVGPYGNLGQLQSLVSQLLSGQYMPTGLGTNPPATLGPNPVRQAQFNPGGQASQADGMQGVWAALAPYLSLLGQGGGGNVLGGQTMTSMSDSSTSLLQSLLNSLLSPASSSPVAGSMAPTPSTSLATSGSALPALTGQPSLAGTGEVGGIGGSAGTGGGSQGGVGAPDLSGPSGFGV